MSLSLTSFTRSGSIGGLPTFFLLTLTPDPHKICVPTFLFLHRISCIMVILVSHLVQHVCQVGVPRQKLHQNGTMYPVQFIYILDISIGRSFQTNLVGSIFLTYFPFHLFASFNPILYLGFMSAQESWQVGF